MKLYHDHKSSEHCLVCKIPLKRDAIYLSTLKEIRCKY